YAARCHRRTIDSEAALTVARDGAQNCGIALGRPRIDRYDDATAVALVDTHLHVADAQDAAHPIVFLEGRLLSGFHQQVRAETLDVERCADHFTESRNRLSRDERQREGVEDAAVLFDHARAFGAELG